MHYYQCFRPLSRRLGFLNVVNFVGMAAVLNLFPSPLEVNGGAYHVHDLIADKYLEFPSPLEVNGGAYPRMRLLKRLQYLSFRPLPR